MNEKLSSADVVILGAGLSGLTLALQLKLSRNAASIVVLERNNFPLPEAAHKVGESTVEIGAHYFSDVLGCRDHLEHCELRKLGLRYFFTRNGNRELDQRLEFGSNHFFPTGSFQIDRGRFENYLAGRCRAAGVTLIEGAKVRDVALDPENSHSVTYTRDGLEQQITCRWVVDAAGRSSLLKKKLGLEAPSNHHPSAAWFRLGCEISINDWSNDPDFTRENVGESSRWFSTNHLMGRGYWVWLIPLASGSTSVGIVADPAMHPLSDFNSLEKAMSWLRRYEPQCAEKLAPHLHTLQDFLALKHYSHRCKQVFSSDRWALTGDAGLFIDPLYSPGSDFIGLSNTFITDLIEKDLANDRLGTHAHIYNELYLGFAASTLSVFENQYSILGNATVMPLKIIWDFASYWGFLAWMFFQKQQCDLSMLMRVRERIADVSRMNFQMQDFFRAWTEVPQEEIGGRMIDIQKLDFIYALNERLSVPVSADTFAEQLVENVGILEELQAEIVGIARRGSKLPGGLLENLVLPEHIAPLPELELEKIWERSTSQPRATLRPALMRAAASPGSVAAED